MVVQGCKTRTFFTRAYMMGSFILLATSISASGKTSDPKGIRQSTSQGASAEKQAYMKAVNDYNHFVEHPQGHVYNVRPKERNLELCYLSAQVVAASVRVPEFAEDRNADGEINEWRRWVDLRKYTLHC